MDGGTDGRQRGKLRGKGEGGEGERGRGADAWMDEHVYGCMAEEYMVSGKPG